MKLVKWVLGIIGVLVVLAVAAIFLLPAERIASIAASRIEAATGRTLTFSDVSPSLMPLGVSVSDLEVANAEWSDEASMVRAGKLKVSVDLASIFSGALRVKGVDIVDPVIVLERSGEGHANWEFDGDETDVTDEGAADGTGSAGFVLDALRIDNGTVVYRDGDQEIMLKNVSLETALKGPDVPLDLSVSAVLGGTGFGLSSVIERPGALFDGGQSGLLATLTLGKATAELTGGLDMAGETMLVGGFDVSIPDLGSVMAAVGQPDVALPDGFGPGVNASGTLEVSGAVLSAIGATVDLGGTVFKGDASVDLNSDLPHVVASLSTASLDLNPMLGSDEEDASDAHGEGWSKDPIALSGLDALTAEFDVAAGQILYGDSTFTDATLSGTIRDGRLSVTVHRMNAYGGSLAGHMTASGNGHVAMSGGLTASGVALQAFMGDFFDFDRIHGTGDVTADVSGAGGSVHALMNDLDGSGNIAFGRGEIMGLDLVGMLRNLDTAFEGTGASTIFDSITATFQIEKGVVTNVDLNLLAPLLEAVGEGTIGLGDRTMNYRVAPKLLQGEGTGFSVPVLITGPWSNLKFRPDLEGLINLQAGDAVKAVKEQVEQQAGEAVKNIEDNVKKSVEEEIKKGLGGLLGGGGN